MFRAGTGGFDDAGLGDGFGCVGFDDGCVCFGCAGDVRGVAGAEARVATRAEDVDAGEQAASITRSMIPIEVLILKAGSLPVPMILGGYGTAGVMRTNSA